MVEPPAQFNCSENARRLPLSQAGNTGEIFKSGLAMNSEKTYVLVKDRIRDGKGRTALNASPN